MESSSSEEGRSAADDNFACKRPLLRGWTAGEPGLKNEDPVFLNGVCFALRSPPFACKFNPTQGDWQCRSEAVLRLA